MDDMILYLLLNTKSRAFNRDVTIGSMCLHSYYQVLSDITVTLIIVISRIILLNYPGI